MLHLSAGVCMHTAPQLRLAAEGSCWRSSPSYSCKPCMAEQLPVHHCCFSQTIRLWLAH